MNSKSKIGIGVVAVVIIIGLISISGVSDPSFYPFVAVVNNASGSWTPGCEPNCFIPSKVTISSGGQVTFVNSDNTEHTATNGTPAEGPLDGFDTGLMQIGDSYTTPKLSSGEYPYFCMVHPWMAGVIIVK